MKTRWESRCLICDHIWKSYSCTEICPECGEIDDVYSEEIDDENNPCNICQQGNCNTCEHK